MAFKPRIGLEPDAIARAWMRKRNGGLSRPCLHALGKTAAVFWKMPGLRILTDDQRELYLRHQGQKPRSPQRRTFPARWQVTTFASAWEAKAHGQTGDARWIVECRTVNAHPEAQTISRHIIKWQAFGMGETPGGLSHNKNASITTNLEDGPRPKRQARAGTALSRLAYNGLKIFSHGDLWVLWFRSSTHLRHIWRRRAVWLRPGWGR